MMHVKMNIEGAEETIKLLDKASSLIDELRTTVVALQLQRGVFAEFANGDEIKSEDVDQ